MKIASFFSGIGGFDLGLEQAGHETVFQAEIDSFCNEILANHWPKVKRVADIREIQNGKDVPRADIWTGGFPCQDVSVARGGQREGLKGKQSGLFYEFIRLLNDALPSIVIIENVPGLLSSHGGKDFGVILNKMADLGYSIAWRMLNSQYFGVPQSRRRLYIVGYRGDSRVAGEILFEPECSTRDSKTSKQSGEAIISPFKESLGNIDTGPIVQRVAYCLAATSGRHTGTDWSRSYVCYPNAVRRLTPTEAERLQGFPHGWTVPSSLASSIDKYESPRYKALGNAVSVPVAKWIGKRINTVLEISHNGKSEDSLALAV